jgi:alpha-beta hydrolase superfamily lysophospholipase
LDWSGISPARPADDEVDVAVEHVRCADGHELPVVRHSGPGGGPAVVYLHGIQSHPGWFVGSAQAMARAGCEVFQLTRRGSGMSGGARGHAPSAGVLLDDVAAGVEHAREQAAAERAAMVGVSWGGKLAAAYLLDRPAAPVASLTLVAPGIAPRVDVPAATKLAIAAAAAFAPRKTFEIPLSDPALFTDHPPMLDYLRRDGLRLHRATARMLLASAVLDRRLARSAAGSLTVPTTLILADHDRIIDNAPTEAAVRRLAAPDALEVLTLPGGHTLEFEPAPEGYFEAMETAVMRE